MIRETEKCKGSTFGWVLAIQKCRYFRITQYLSTRWDQYFSTGSVGFRRSGLSVDDPRLGAFADREADVVFGLPVLFVADEDIPVGQRDVDVSS